MVKSIKTTKGQSLFEVIIAIGITSMILVAIINTAILSVRNTSFSRNKTLASRHSQQAVEWLRGERDANWDTFSARSNTVWCMSNLDWTKNRICTDTDNIPTTPFKREISLTNTSGQQIDAKVKVYWNDSQGYHEVKVSTYFTDWRVIK
jgi:Tfp pilus assembly protein PilV